MRSFQREITKNGFIKKIGPYWYQLTSVWIILHFFLTYQMQSCCWSYSHFYFTLVLRNPILHKLLMCFLKCSNLYFVITLKVFYKHCKTSGTWWWDNVDPSLPPHLLFSACLLSRDVCENPVPALVNCFPEQCHYFSMVCLRRTFCTFSYKINSRRLSILQGACRSSWGRFSKKRPETLSHSEPLENCNSGFSTYLFYFRYLFYTSFSPLPPPFLTLVFVIYLSSSEHRLLKLIQFWIGPFLSRSLSLCAERPARLSIINVSASQPLSSTRRNPQNVSLAPPSQPLWTAHIWKCQWANLSATEQVLGSQRALHQSSNPVKIWR